ncbi:hypothetical protein GF407_19120 [candidate division KSB1 bacterium]|nr:hypothetical protein [candidate division KSB1 bacterium]
MNKALILIMLLLIAIAARAQQTSTDTTTTGDDYPSPGGAMWRSLVVPGWGQAYNKKWLKTGIFAAAEIGLAANAIVQNQYKQKATNWAEEEYYRNNRSLSVWWLAGVILYSMGDAYVDAHLYHFDDEKSLTLNIKMENHILLTTMTFNF